MRQGKIADTLLVLLHIGIMRHTTDTKLEFALISALQLAEGGKTVKERRVGQSPLDHLKLQLRKSE